MMLIIKNVISEEKLASLYESLGLTEENFVSNNEVGPPQSAADSFLDASDGLFRKEALHLFGVDEMSTQEVFDYFKEFKAFAVEWINDSSCNVVWRNETHAANALIGMSVAYKPDDSESFFKDEQENDRIMGLTSSKFLRRKPPQDCRWRIGVKSVKNHQIYMRFVRRSDRKQKGAEARSNYYVKYGNPNYGNITGLISNSKRKRLRAQQMSDAVSGLFEEEKEDGEEVDEVDEQPGQARGAKLISYELGKTIFLIQDINIFFQTQFDLIRWLQRWHWIWTWRIWHSQTNRKKRSYQIGDHYEATVGGTQKDAFICWWLVWQWAQT